MPKKFQFKKIGLIRTPYVNNAPYQPVDEDKGEFRIEVDTEYTEGAILLDGIGFFEKYSTEHPEEVLDFSDWMELHIKADKVSLDRLKNLLLKVAEQGK